MIILYSPVRKLASTYIVDYDAKEAWICVSDRFVPTFMKPEYYIPETWQKWDYAWSTRELSKTELFMELLK